MYRASIGMYHVSLLLVCILFLYYHPHISLFNPFLLSVKFLDSINFGQNIEQFGDGDLFKYYNRSGNEHNDNTVGDLMIKEALNSQYNYFEIKIMSTHADGVIIIGVGGNDYSLSRHGCLKGFCFIDGEHVRKLCMQSCEVGDQLGCGVGFEESSDYVNVFFTRNGQQCGGVVKYKQPSGGLYPIIVMGIADLQVQYVGHRHYEAPIDLLIVSLYYGPG